MLFRHVPDNSLLSFPTRAIVIVPQGRDVTSVNSKRLVNGFVDFFFESCKVAFEVVAESRHVGCNTSCQFTMLFPFHHTRTTSIYIHHVTPEINPTPGASSQDAFVERAVVVISRLFRPIHATQHWATIIPIDGSLLNKGTNIL